MHVIQFLSLWLIPILIACILLHGTYKRVPTYEAFVEGGKREFKSLFLSFRI